MNDALRDVRVIDLSGGLAGPICSMLLARAGAEVLRVEGPGADPLRTSASGTWTRGTKSVTLDLTQPTDVQELRKLLETADVLLHSYSPATQKRLGLTPDFFADYEQLVRCSITAYGSEGARAERPAYDALVQAATGLGFEQPGHRPGPIFNWIPLPSYGAGMLAACGIAAALRVREHTGRGQQVDTSLLQGVLAFTTMPWIRAQHAPPAFDAVYRYREISPTPCYRASDDRWIHPMPEAVPAILDHLGLAADALAGSSTGTHEERRLWQESVQSLLEQRPAQEWLNLFWERDIRCQPVLSVDEGRRHPQAIAIGAVVETERDGVLTREFGDPFSLQPSPGVGAAGAAALRKGNPHAPLEGITVLDFGLALAGPYAPMLLSDLGAEVIRVDNVNAPRATDNQVWAACQRGKRSITLDLKSDEGRALVRQLLERADVIHHNMRPGVAERLGIGYEQVRAIKPAIIYAHVTGFGPDGPLVSSPGSDQMGQALSGLEHEQGATSAGGHPTWNRLGVCDHAAAMLSLVGVLQALFRRDRTGQGALVEANILTAATFLGSHAPSGDGTTPFPGLDRDQTGLGPLWRLYEAADGWLCITAPTDEHRASLARALGRKDLFQDPRFADSSSRHRHAEALAQLISSVLRTRPMSDWLVTFDATGVPAEAANSGFADTWFADQDLRGAGMVASYEHAAWGLTEQLGLLWRFSETPARLFGPPVIHGQHSREILQELGMDEKDIERLVHAGVTSIPDLSH